MTMFQKVLMVSFMNLGRRCGVVFSLLMGLSLCPDDVEANKAHQILTDKTNQERNEALTVLLNQSKKDCDVVVKTFFQGFEPEGGAFWSVACGNGHSYMILIENDARGSTRVMDCAMIQSLTKGRNKCFKKLK